MTKGSVSADTENLSSLRCTVSYSIVKIERKCQVAGTGLLNRGPFFTGRAPPPHIFQ